MPGWNLELIYMSLFAVFKCFASTVRATSYIRKVDKAILPCTHIYNSYAKQFCCNFDGKHIAIYPL